MDKPDALKIYGGPEIPKNVSPLQWLRQKRKQLDDAAKLLGVGPNENVVDRKQPDGNYRYISKSHDQTLLFPGGHEFEGYPRYDWKPHPEMKGVFLGYLVPEAKEQAPEKVDQGTIVKEAPDAAG